MRDSILYSALRALCVAFCVIIGITLGFMAISMLVGAIASGGIDQSKLTTVYTEEILPNAKGERKVVASTAPVILQINVDSVIGLEDLTDKTIRQMLIESREGEYKHDRVKGILLRIDTPGGTVTDADGIYRELVAYKKKYNVPIYAYVDGLCASGGVYVSLAADKIYSTESSLIGSVGVIAPTFMNFTKLLDKVGVDALTISAGKDKDALNPLRPWKPGEEDNYKQIIDYFYGQFVDLVVLNRPEMSKEKLVQDYGARIFPAATAKEYGYIDYDKATIGEALEELAKAAGITDNNYQVIRLEDKGWLHALLGTKHKSPLFSGRIKHSLTVSPEFDLMLQNKFLYLYVP